MKELTRYTDGRAVLDDDGDVLWSSDNDDAFQSEFGETIDPEDLDDVVQYLLDAEYLEENESLDIVDEDDEDTQTVETLDLDDVDEDEDAEALH